MRLFLSACCVQVVITVPSCVLSAFKTVSSSSVWLLEAPAAHWSCWKLGYWRISCSPAALVCTSTRKYNALPLGTKIHTSVLEHLLNVESICIYVVKGCRSSAKEYIFWQDNYTWSGRNLSSTSLVLSSSVFETVSRGPTSALYRQKCALSFIS